MCRESPGKGPGAGLRLAPQQHGGGWCGQSRGGRARQQEGSRCSERPPLGASGPRGTQRLPQNTKAPLGGTALPSWPSSSPHPGARRPRSTYSRSSLARLPQPEHRPPSRAAAVLQPVLPLPRWLTEAIGMQACHPAAAQPWPRSWRSEQQQPDSPASPEYQWGLGDTGR